MAGVTLPDTPETRKALETARALATSRYNDMSNCKNCDLTKANEFKQTADLFTAALEDLEKKI